VDFELTEEQKLIRSTARRIAQERVAPRAAEIDQTKEYPEDIFQLYKEQGLLGLAIPTEYGGSGAGIVGLCLAIEEVAKYCCSSGLILLLSLLPTAPILIAGNEEQKQTYVRKVAEGQYRAAFGLTEPDAGSDVANMRTRAVREGNEYILNGEKCFISGATVGDFYTIFAKTDPAAGNRGVSAFIVPRNAPGFSVGRVDKKMGVRGVPTAQLVMQDCRIPAENMLGQEGQGFKTAMLSLNYLRGAVGARALGLAEGALQYAVEYARNRYAYGEPIINLQGLQFMIADMVSQIEAARLLMYQAALMVDHGKYLKEDAGMLSVAKLLATEMAVKVASDALQLLGANGYMEDHPLERMYRDVRQLTIVEGTSQIQRVHIARAIVDRDIVY